MSKERKIIHLDDDAYSVGYCKPPKTSQFKKGQSGNPRGRKHRVSYEEDDFPIRKFMLEFVPVKIDGGSSR